MLKDLNLELHSSIYVGDELRDLKACQKIGMNIILVSWGWNNLDLLKTASPKHIANSTEALVGIINSHFST
jgi:phosphoglycolate phosphatase